MITTGLEPLGVAIDQTTGLALVTNSNANSNSVTSFTATLAGRGLTQLKRPLQMAQILLQLL